MKQLLFCLLGLFFCSSMAYAQSDLLKLQDKLVGLSPDTSFRRLMPNKKHEKLSPEQVKSIKKFWKVFKDIRDQEIDLDLLKGKASFSFLGNTAKNSDIFRINGGITLSKASFPQEFEFSTLLNIQADNGKLQENLSNLRIAYDRFLLKDKFLLEGFSFINRRNDQLLGVNQRYELGGGVILAYWHRKLHRKSQDKYNKYKEEQISFKSETDKVIVCSVKDCVPIDLKGITKEDFGALNTSKQKILNSLIKQHSPLRVGILFGLFLEVENITHSDTLATKDNGEKFFKEEFETTSRFRWELRPTFDFRLSDEIKFTVRPYIKFPMPWEWKVDVKGEEVTDLRVDFPVTFNIEIDKNFELNFNYILYYDHAPNSVLLTDDVRPDSTPLYLSANDTHHYYNFQVTYKFK